MSTNNKHEETKHAAIILGRTLWNCSTVTMQTICLYLFEHAALSTFNTSLSCTVNYLICDYFCLCSTPAGTQCLEVNLSLWSRIRTTGFVYCSKQPFKNNNVPRMSIFAPLLLQLCYKAAHNDVYSKVKATCNTVQYTTIQRSIF